MRFAINSHLLLSECRGFHNQGIHHSNWLRSKPDDAKLAGAVLTTVELALESESAKIA